MMAKKQRMGSWDFASLPKLLATMDVLNKIDLHTQLTHRQRNEMTFVRSLVMSEITALLIDAASGHGDFLLLGLSKSQILTETDDIPF